MLKADKSSFKNSITLNEFIITSHNEYCAAAPLIKGSPQSIRVYYFPSVPIKSYISLAEFYSRQVYYNNFKGFVPHFFVDSAQAWQLLKCDQSKEIVVVICGDTQKAKTRTVDLIYKLLKDYQIDFNNILNTERINDLLKAKGIEPQLPFLVSEQEPECGHEEIIEITPKAAQCTFEVYFSSQWQQPVKGKPIQAIRINITEGELSYRTHLINGKWQPWVKNGEMSGSDKSYIDGFQINYISQKNTLYYRFSIINSKPISWRTANIMTPTRQYIDSFDFKIE